MDIVKLGRENGKTWFLVNRSADTGYPIICNCQVNKKYIEQIAKDNNLNIPEPIIIDKKNIDILKNKSSEKYLIDDIDFFIEHMLNIVIDCATTSSNILYKLNLDTKERV